MNDKNDNNGIKDNHYINRNENVYNGKKKDVDKKKCYCP